MNVEAAAVGAASGFVMACIAIAGFLVNRQSARAALSERITGCEKDSANALMTAAEIDNESKDFRDKHSAEVAALHAKIETVNAAWGMKWETMLREFVSHEELRSMERRLIESGQASEGRITLAISGLVNRVDGIVDRGHN